MVIVWDGVGDFLDITIFCGDCDIVPSRAKYFDVVCCLFGGAVECDAVGIIEGGGKCLR